MRQGSSHPRTWPVREGKGPGESNESDQMAELCPEYSIEWYPIVDGSELRELSYRYDERCLEIAAGS